MFLHPQVTSYILDCCCFANVSSCHAVRCVCGWCSEACSTLRLDKVVKAVQKWKVPVTSVCLNLSTVATLSWQSKTISSYIKYILKVCLFVCVLAYLFVCLLVYLFLTSLLFLHNSSCCVLPRTLSWWCVLTERGRGWYFICYWKVRKNAKWMQEPVNSEWLNVRRR